MTIWDRIIDIRLRGETSIGEEQFHAGQGDN